MPRPSLLAPALALGMAAAAAAQAPLDPDAQRARELGLRDWGRALGSAGYVYGVPLLEVAIAEYRQTQGIARDVAAPYGLFAHFMGNGVPTHETSWLVAPDPALLHSSAWIQVAEQPFVLWLPPLEGHWYSVELRDQRANLSGVLSPRTAGSVGGWHLVAHESFTGEKPPGIQHTELRVATPGAWLLVRIAASAGEAAAFHERYQAQLKLLPLEQYARNPKAAPYASPTPQPAPPPLRALPEMRGTLDGLRVIHQKLRALGAAPGEAALFALFDRAGFGPGVDFDPARLPKPLAEGLRDGARAGARLARDLRAPPERPRSGWRPWPAPPAAPDDTLGHAVSAAAGLGASDPRDVYATSVAHDVDGRRLDGRNDYTLRFGAGARPPARAFWTLAAYDAASGRLLDTRGARPGLSSATPGLASGADGSFSVFVSSDEPEDDPARRANWLPVRNAPFVLVARLYDPEPAALEGAWLPPPVRPADD
jgi:hypothetical protein